MHCRPWFGYCPNPSKSWLILKPEFADLASSVFADVKLNFTPDGHKYLGSAIGSEDFISMFVKENMSDWIALLVVLTSIAQTQPHAAYSGFIHGLLNKWVYLSRTTPNVERYANPLEDHLRMKFLT